MSTLTNITQLQGVGTIGIVFTPSPSEYTTNDYTTNAYGWVLGNIAGSGITGSYDNYDFTTTEITGSSGYVELVWTTTNIKAFGGGTCLAIGAGGGDGDFFGNGGLLVYSETANGYKLFSNGVSASDYVAWGADGAGTDTFKLISTGDNAYLYVNDVLKITINVGSYRTTGFIGYHLDNGGAGSFIRQVQYKTSA